MFNKKKHEEPADVPAFSYKLLRNDVLPELLGEDESVILYYIGRTLARKHADNWRENGVPIFFQEAGWGLLDELKTKANRKTYVLSVDFAASDTSFALETGFLAQVTENETGHVTEATYEVKETNPQLVHIYVKTDRKDPRES
ncbi:DUF2507 domain-containing protein [Salisediminibacterium halotolerans]|uniref:DUF2507 domain-containing protein n=1 Tax=Salisediminibacterium halotolerans TaxID=517425 RepID=A0A1H9U2L9_9BACI|nr:MULTISPECIES: DUF2507 domain-containing protein [Salisediminibacterium]RLJ81122.1 uncharacterized protein DUF2507 [Actinophytocola xinjiangensis]RPE84069.1 uncharacterized protein DUF2507 [Salisediminibacterium halotolerans]TWG38549.1 uncharacterized protein DUF2507 [Salisediminibacterium halotolerans]SES03417.1 Protein of unknown function [Salisediminibacterium haloalkalitolerans]GEL07175.1 hypothetical protein SHA02_05910 [Salisediminibacterium halotolerans]